MPCEFCPSDGDEDECVNREEHRRERRAENAHDAVDPAEEGYYARKAAGRWRLAAVCLTALAVVLLGVLAFACLGIPMPAWWW